MRAIINLFVFIFPLLQQEVKKLVKVKLKPTLKLYSALQDLLQHQEESYKYPIKKLTQLKLEYTQQ